LVAANASLQVVRVAAPRDVDLEMLLQLMEDATIQGGSRILEAFSANVLVLNISLEEARP
jgi:K+-transporting ATPase c subunit